MRDLSSLTRDRTRAPCSGSVESQPLDLQGSPSSFNFYLELYLQTYDFLHTNYQN